MRAQDSFVLSQSMHLTDRQTDRGTERPWQYRALHYMQSHGKNLYVRNPGTVLMFVTSKSFKPSSRKM